MPPSIFNIVQKGFSVNPCAEKLFSSWLQSYPPRLFKQAVEGGMQQKSVSYTHLDVYKRQHKGSGRNHAKSAGGVEQKALYRAAA